MSLARKWLELIANDLEDFTNGRAVGFQADPRTPSWVRQIDEKLNRAIFPEELQKGEPLTPEKVGRVLGQSYACFGWILDCVRRNDGAFQDQFSRGLKDVLEGDYDPSLDEELREQADFGFAFQFCRFQHLLKRALSLVVERPFMESARFFQGFTSAVRLRAKDDTAWTDKLTTAGAYFVMQRDWEFVESFKNVSDLHRFLQHKLGRAAAGDLDRTRTLAKRIGLKLAARGRPSKNWVKVSKKH